MALSCVLQRCVAGRSSQMPANAPFFYLHMLPAGLRTTAPPSGRRSGGSYAGTRPHRRTMLVSLSGATKKHRASQPAVARTSPPPLPRRPPWSALVRLAYPPGGAAAGTAAGRPGHKAPRFSRGPAPKKRGPPDKPSRVVVARRRLTGPTLPGTPRRCLAPRSASWVVGQGIDPGRAARSHKSMTDQNNRSPAALPIAAPPAPPHGPPPPPPQAIRS